MVVNAIKVLIVDDSAFFRATLQKSLSSDQHIEIVGTASNAVEAEKKIKELSPDVVIVDVEMPDMHSTDFLKQLILTKPLPVMLVGSTNISVFEALDAGAVDFVKKPNNNNESDFAAFCSELSVKIKIASSAKVRKMIVQPPSLPLPDLNVGSFRKHIIAIGASTGGTEATLEILKQLPADIPGILVVQHMPAGFTKMYAERLDRICKISVSEAKDGDRVRQGHALIAAGEYHMTLKKDAAGYYVHCAPGLKVSGHCPSVDVLFDSVAKTAGSDAVGVILTGMGRDGAEGLLSMRNAGASTIGQDKQSCVVYGMPMVAYDIGAVETQASCQAISGILIQKINA
ncbi:MAG TPA: chemotaxis response regulator protein-glutamate methylesterase [Oscillospiraceae bacterium]|nr:chemotaxis response regulator protein-glutamate methylesterase [Oscillospiraceae bacterium]